MKKEISDELLSDLFREMKPDENTCDRVMEKIREKAPKAKVRGYRNNMLKVIGIYAIAVSAVFAAVWFVLPLFGQNPPPTAAGQTENDLSQTTARTDGDVSTTPPYNYVDPPSKTDVFGHLWIEHDSEQKRIWQDVETDPIPEGLEDLTKKYKPHIPKDCFTLGVHYGTQVSDYPDDDTWHEEMPHQLIDGDKLTYMTLGLPHSDTYFVFTYTEPVITKGYTLSLPKDRIYWPQRTPRAFAILGTNKEIPDGWELTSENACDWEIVDFVYDMDNPAGEGVDTFLTVTPPGNTVWFDLSHNDKAYTTYMFYLRSTYDEEIFSVSEITLYGNGA